MRIDFDPHDYVTDYPFVPDDAPEYLPQRSVERKIVTLLASDLHGRAIPVRSEHVPGLIPGRTVTLLTGDGGTGKSLLAKMLSCSTALGSLWLGREVRRGRVLYLSAEDELDELHRRLVDIVHDLGASLSDLDDLRLVPLAGEDAVLAAPNGRAGIIAGTPLWTAIETEAADWQPILIVLDTLADLFAGEENHRAQARQFIGMLRGLALKHDAAVLLLSHPSLSGISTGTGTSGSTGWSNSVRSRLYLKRATMRDDQSKAEIEPDPDLRVLTTMKANYGPVGGDIRMRWQQGVFRLEEDQRPSAFEAVGRAMHAESSFLDLVGKYALEGRHVSATPSANYAPSVFAKDPRAQGLNQHALRAAMNTLFGAGKIVVREVGPPSKRRQSVVLAQTPEKE